MPVSPETSERVDQLRARAGLPPDHPNAITTLEECKEMVALLRGDRMTAQAQAKKSKARVQPPIDINKILEGF